MNPSLQKQGQSTNYVKKKQQQNENILELFNNIVNNIQNTILAKSTNVFPETQETNYHQATQEQYISRKAYVDGVYQEEKMYQGKKIIINKDLNQNNYKDLEKADNNQHVCSKCQKQSTNNQYQDNSASQNETIHEKQLKKKEAFHKVDIYQKTTKDADDKDNNKSPEEKKEDMHNKLNSGICAIATVSMITTLAR